MEPQQTNQGICKGSIHNKMTKFYICHRLIATLLSSGLEPTVNKI